LSEAVANKEPSEFNERKAIADSCALIRRLIFGDLSI
jgi:hypothetical protein